MLLPCAFIVGAWACVWVCKLDFLGCFECFYGIIHCNVLAVIFPFYLVHGVCICVRVCVCVVFVRARTHVLHRVLFACVFSFVLCNCLLSFAFNMHIWCYVFDPYLSCIYHVDLFCMITLSVMCMFFLLLIDLVSLLACL